MKNLAISLLSLIPLCIAFADEPVCEKCHIIREYNAAHPENNTTWYEDWQKTHPEARPAPTAGEVKKEAQLAACSCGEDKKPRGPRGTILAGCPCGCGKDKKDGKV